MRHPLKLLRLFVAAVLLSAVAVDATPVTWKHDSRLSVTQTSQANGDGSFTYSLELVNQEPDGLWFAGFYTGEFAAYDFHASLPAWDANAYIDYAAAGEDWSLAGAPDSWTVNFFDPDGPGSASLAAGATAQLSFRLDGGLSGAFAPIRYGYFAEGDYEWNRYTAVGPAPAAVPEPSAMALMILGLALLASANSRIFRRMLSRSQGMPSPGDGLPRESARHADSKPGGAPSKGSQHEGINAVPAGRFPVKAMGATLMTLAAFHVPAAAAEVVISQIYGGGGNSGATYTHDFIELHNRGTVAVDLAGWSVQYASAAGTAWQRTPLTGSIQPGGYYLVQEAQGAAGTQALPPPDATGTLAMSAASGKVALSQSAGALTGACPAGVVDLAGYGAANCFEGSGPAQGLTNTTAALRGGDGCAETEDNASDFARGAPDPRNSAAPSRLCPGEAPPTVVALSPASGSAGAAPQTDITVDFSEAVSVTETWFEITGSASGAHLATVTGGPTRFILDPLTDFLPEETIHVRIFADRISDRDVADPPDHPLADFTADFITAGIAKISAIQGRSHSSPRAGQAVAGVAGVVTELLGNGFFLQDPDPDTDPGTSDGIFVFTSAAPTVQVGDRLSVDAMVSEYRPGGASGDNLTVTELVSPVIRNISSGNPLPDPIQIGSGGRYPPHDVIDDDATGSVETSGTFDPDFDGIDFFESLEGMRVQIADPVVIGPRNGFGEFFVLGDGGAGATLRTNRGGLKVRPTDFNPERILVDAIAGPAGPVPPFNVGDTFLGPITGVLDYQFGNYRVMAGELPGPVPGGLQPEIAVNPCQNQLTIATFNVENLDPSDTDEKFNRLAGIIVANLRSPLLLALEEVQDNNGAVNDGTVDASATAARLISAILAAGGPVYKYVDIAPEDRKDGGEPGGNIRVAFLYQQDKGLVFIPRPGGTAVSSVRAVKTPTGVRLSSSPGRIDPLNPAFENSRKPLVGEFSYKGRTFFVVANHFNSKGGDQPLMGRFQPPVRSSEVQRKLQAAAVNAFARSVLDLDPCARIVVTGDFNDFEFSESMLTLQGAALKNLSETLPEPERYTYVYEGNSQSLDHILVSQSLFAQPGNEYDIVHVNSEFADQVSDHEPQRACFDKGPPDCRVRFP